MKKPELEPKSDQHIQKAFELVRMCNGDEKHARQVCQLALKLFDQLNPMLLLPTESRNWLETAAILHDIGWVQGQQKHHKAALETILSTSVLDLTNKERLIIGSIARYHRGANPSRKHDHYAALGKKEQKVVYGLSAILRVANALDSSHISLVKNLVVEIKKRRLVVICDLEREAVEERTKVKENRALLEKVCALPIKFDWIHSETKPDNFVMPEKTSDEQRT